MGLARAHRVTSAAPVKILCLSCQPQWRFLDGASKTLVKRRRSAHHHHRRHHHHQQPPHPQQTGVLVQRHKEIENRTQNCPCLPNDPTESWANGERQVKTYPPPRTGIHTVAHTFLSFLNSSLASVAYSVGLKKRNEHITRWSSAITLIPRCTRR